MAPNSTSFLTNILFEDDETIDTERAVQSNADKKINEDHEYKVELVWRNIILFSLLHISAIYGFYLIFTSARIATTLFSFVLIQVSILGITAGVHRLWSHRSYKATWQLRLILTIFNTIAFQDPIIHWARDHRLHHKYSETNADPHNSKRGFFYAHIGWLLCRKHPDVKEKGKGIDLTDLYSDPILTFQKKYYFILMPIMCFIIPSVIPVYFWNETWINAIFVSTLFRYACSLNALWAVNSIAHVFGNKPYDRFISPAQNGRVAAITLGEGWHNYHHTFPWDYRSAELGDDRYNFTTRFIDFFAWIGWAYDLKTCSAEVVRKRVLRTGDGSHEQKNISYF